MMNNVNTSWLLALNNLLYHSDFTCSPRGMEVSECLAYTTHVSMQKPALNIAERKLNHAFMFGEAYWILSGSNRVEDIKPFMNRIADYSDNGITFRGAYGPKVVEQLDYVQHALTNDMHSRQALLTIWRENPMPSKDIPCTVALQFFIRKDKLHCSVYMRSSDIWLGWVYDVFNFSMIAAWLCIALRPRYPELQLGELSLTAGSQHIYESNYEAGKKILNTVSKQLGARYNKLQRPINLDQFSHPDELLSALRSQAVAYANKRGPESVYSIELFA